MKDEQSSFRDQLNRYSEKIGQYGAFLVVILILFIPLRLFCEYKNWIACSEENGDCTNPDRYNNIYQQLILEILLQVIVCITIVVAIIPEALPLAFGVTINTYMKQTIMSTKYVNKRASQFNSSPLGQTACESDDQEKLIFQNIKSIETIGQVNCLLLEICVNDDHQGDKFDDNAKQQAKFESDKLINSVCYLRKCKGFKEKNKVLELLICSQDSYEQVQKNLIVPVS